MLSKSVLIALSLLAVAITGQQVGTLEKETHPKLTWQRCTAKGSCSNVAGSVVLDSNWRWLHNIDGYANCYDGNHWVDEYCPDPKACAKNCALEGANYSGTYGITAGGTSLKHQFVTEGEFSTNIGSRVYLMDSSDSKYEMFKLLNKEFTFDVDVSQLPCGLNGALYFSEMEADGGASTHSAGNKAGAKYGTGYCDAQCPHDIKFINGEANMLDWNESDTDPNAGRGRYGTCCQEMDIWEANSISTAYTPHPCSVDSQKRCEGSDCGDEGQRYDGVCDKDGCDFNSFRLGDKAFFGPGKLVDTNSKFTVVTQFITEGNSDTGDLKEIRRIYKQNGKVIQNSQINVPGVTAGNSITDAFCAEGKTAFGDNNHYEQLGGLKRIAEGFKKGVVLVMSIWDDHAAHMLWLNSDYPLDKDPSEPGVSRGTCSRDSGNPKDVEAESPNASVTFSNIKFGPIDSTY